MGNIHTMHFSLFFNNKTGNAEEDLKREMYWKRRVHCKYKKMVRVTGAFLFPNAPFLCTSISPSSDVETYKVKTNYMALTIKLEAMFGRK